jgi:3-oxoacyl-[acyl-carrier-protein] synthase-1
MRIVISGIGVVSSIGNNVSENMDSLLKAKDGMGEVTLFSTSNNFPVSEVKLSNNDLKKRLGLSLDATISRTSLLGMSAAKEALLDSSIDKNLRIGLISSTSVGGMDLSEGFYREFREDNNKGRLRDICSHDCGASTENIADYLNIKDHIDTLSTACSSSANAIMQGAELIKNGFLDCVLVGGTDALCQFTLNGFKSLQILDNGKCKPFDANRLGLNLGEGAGFIVIQSEESKPKKNYCFLQGYANTNDAYHQTASSPEGKGPYTAMQEALEMSGLHKEDIDYLNAHGTGTNNNDLSEITAIHRFFGDKSPLFSSTKAYTGHTLGAAGGIEAVYSILAIQHQLAFANLNYNTPIADIPLSPITSNTKTNISTVMSNSFGFGGNCSSLIFSK